MKYLRRQDLVKYSKLHPQSIKWRLYISQYPKKYGIVIIGGVKMVSERDFLKYWKPKEGYSKTL